jgi:hypothetical protein
VRRSTKFRDEFQASRALRALLQSSPGTADMWMATGPTTQALAFVRAGGGPLAGGERILLLAAFALWNGQGGIALAEVVEKLDLRPAERLCSLVVAIKRGAQAIDDWIGAAARAHVF